ncbi:type VII secretion protein EccCb [Streptomyces sp. NPDC047108]|uniref:type VII secretion protein EccCb n=1 Tax=Streptomyces sp. NPDC047108 TaxID=3155025 RepID=UPI0033E7A4B1
MTRAALLIATTEYVDPGLRLLRSPAQDARRLGALLDDPSIGYFDRVTMLVNESKASVEEHIEEFFRNRAASDTLLLYLSSHGIRDKHGRLFFTTVRTRRELPDSTAVSARFVEEQMSRCRASGKILLLDCCYGGAFVQGMEPFAAESEELTAQAAGKGTYVMAASDVLEFAYEGEQMKHRSGPFRSVFTEAVVDGLTTGRADADNDGVITAHELFAYIQAHVRETGVPQTPTEFTSGVQGNIPVAKAALWHRGAGTDADPFAVDGLPLGELLPALVPTEERGLCAPDWPPNGSFAVPIGRMYDPAQGLQETLTVDLSGGAAHVGVVGGMWSGKTSVLRTLACSLALTHSPEEMQIYALHGEPDGLARLTGLPHVGKVADYAEGEEVRELVEGVTATLDRREQLCAQLRVRSPRRFRALRMRGELPEERNGEIFLLIDSWREFQTRYAELARQVLRVAQQGAYYGVHLAVSAGRWQDFPEDLALHLTTWIELALAAPQESRIDAELAGGIPPGGPGFGLTRGRRYVRIALPTLADPRAEEDAPASGASANFLSGTAGMGAGGGSGGAGATAFDDEAVGLDRLVGRVAESWTGPKAAPLDTRPAPASTGPGFMDLLDVDPLIVEPARTEPTVGGPAGTDPFGGTPVSTTPVGATPTAVHAATPVDGEPVDEARAETDPLDADWMDADEPVTIRLGTVRPGADEPVADALDTDRRETDGPPTTRPETDGPRATSPETARRVTGRATTPPGARFPGPRLPVPAWAPRPPARQLTVPLGVDPTGKRVLLDPKAAADGGWGPHGLLLGATASGKSELLRTLVLGLASQHSPEDVNFFLLDYKGTATFSGLDRLHHVTAVVADLEAEPSHAERLSAALTGELQRRQDVLRSAGSYASRTDYEKARAAGAPLEPLPALFVIVDEFSELLTAHPWFLDLFVAIGRVGRSLGIHLLLSAQHIEESALKGLDTYLSYRIALRTGSAAVSRAALGTPDAYTLPVQPGGGYLKVGLDSMTRFQAPYVSGRVRPDSEETVYDTVIDRIAGLGPLAHQVLLPPLDAPPTLDRLLPVHTWRSGSGGPAVPHSAGHLRVPAGVVDRPFQQRRDVLHLDFTERTGHLAIVGGPLSGKSTLLRTLVCSLALTHTPRDVQFYCLDFGGGSLQSLSGLPHVGGVASRLQPDQVHRTVADMTALLDRRQREAAEPGADSHTPWRRRQGTAGTGAPAGDPYGDVFLVVDNWAVLRETYEQLEPAVIDLAARGHAHGIHVVITATRWIQVRAAAQDLFPVRLELRLGDTFDSSIDGGAAAGVPEGRPGRGLAPDGAHFLAALPRIDGEPGDEGLTAAVESLVTEVARAWSGPPAPPVRLLPDVLPADQLPAPSGDRIAIGTDEQSLAPVHLDFAKDPHFVVIGDSESGKSNLLRLIAEGLVTSLPPERARLMVVDYRRSLLDTAVTEHRIAYVASASALGRTIDDVVQALQRRLPGPDVTPEQLRSRSWWTGPDLYLLVDDLDLVTTTSADPLHPLAELLPMARDIGFHLVLARSFAGAGRSMFHPLMQRLREMGTPALVLSGTKEEGELFGVRPRHLPPGRGQFVDRRAGSRLIQTALLTPEDA